ncbi:Alpha/Beta hydrolase protein [Calycina marina]|uniref:1-alkyl-2-acetylglycerophosphocholine esterase n=1 Tax=Calycina marina TaxID=1763456 RepID=A0A9P7YUX8_9HELO|nr:Alpha/Beta hydrolase protein [Calycina marina]
MIIMRPNTLLSTILLGTLTCQGASVSMPSLLGHSLVGTVSMELVDESRIDPYAPTPQPRDLMISVFYPVQHVRRYHLANAYTNLYAGYLDTLAALVPGTAKTIVSQAYQGAHLHQSASDVPPIIIFSPGYTGSRVDHTQTLSNLASHGYLVIGVDHPYDTGFVDYPDGRTAVNYKSLVDNDEDRVAAQEVRVKDIQFVLNTLATNATAARQIPGVHGALKAARVGIFGHSFGGAATANTLAVDLRFVCGANMDGSVYGPALSTGIDKPLMFFDTGPIHNRTTDTTWSILWEKLHGFKLELSFEGATHVAFSDQAVLYDYLRALDLIPSLGDFFGSIMGERMLELEYAYLTSFFDRCLRHGGGELLDGPSAKYPEVFYWPAS